MVLVSILRKFLMVWLRLLVLIWKVLLILSFYVTKLISMILRVRGRILILRFLTGILLMILRVHLMLKFPKRFVARLVRRCRRLVVCLVRLRLVLLSMCLLTTRMRIRLRRRLFSTLVVVTRRRLLTMIGRVLMVMVTPRSVLVNFFLLSSIPMESFSTRESGMDLTISH